MPKEIPDLIQQNSTPKKLEKESGGLEIFRSKIVRALVLGSSLALFQACGLKEEEIEKLPKVTVSDLQKDPKKYETLPMLQTEGYPVYDKRGRTDSDSFIDIFDDHSYEYFELHEGIEKTGTPPLRIFIDRGESNLVEAVGGLIEDLKKEHSLKPHKFRIVGKLYIRKNGPSMEVLDSKDLTQVTEDAKAKKP